MNSVSSVLKRKKKKMQPLGYNKQELTGIYNYSKDKSAKDKVIYKAFMDVRLISYLILHDKFGFGQKRIVRLEDIVDIYRTKSEMEVKYSDTNVASELKEASSIDIREEADKVPFRECLSLSERKEPVAGQLVSRVLFKYFSLSCKALKKYFRFSVNKLKEYMHWVRYYINTLSRRQQFEVTIKDIAEVLMEECKYCDARFVK